MSILNDEEAEPLADAVGTGKRNMGDGGTEPSPDDEGTGYKRPPKKHQFKSGKSGNPKGRPKGALGLRAIVEAELGERVRGTHNGKLVRLSKQQVIVKRLADKAMNGDQRAIQQLLDLSLKFGGGVDERVGEPPLTEGELAFLNAAKNRQPSGDAAAGLVGDPEALLDDNDDSDAD